MSQKKKRVTLEDLIKRFYYESSDIFSLLKNSDNLLKLDKGVKIKGLIVVSNSEIIETVKKWTFSEYNFNIKEKRGDIFHCNLEKSIKKDNEFIQGDFLLIKCPNQQNIYMILTQESINFFNNGIIRFFNKFHPLISRTYIDTEYIEKILERFESGLNHEKIWISKQVTKSWVRNILAKKKVESDIKWTDLPFREAFLKISENQEWIKSINFNLINNDQISDISIDLRFNSKKSYKIERDTRFQCNYNFSYFYQRIIEGMINQAAESFRFFNNRERTVENNYSINPITIEYDFEIFRDKNQNIRLIEALRNISGSSLSVMHSNPYLHASYVDYRDGSSCDIWVLSNNRISIIPQIRSTPAALERLCENIFTGFREGKYLEKNGDD